MEPDIQADKSLEQPEQSDRLRVAQLMMLATQTEAAQVAYHCLSPAELERRKQQKRKRRARLKLLAHEKAAKQVRRRTLSGGKQRREQGGVRKKSAASRRRSAERTSSWVRNQPNSFSDDDGESWMQPASPDQKKPVQNAIPGPRYYMCIILPEHVNIPQASRRPTKQAEMRLRDPETSD